MKQKSHFFTMHCLLTSSLRRSLFDKLIGIIEHIMDRNGITKRDEIKSTCIRLSRLVDTGTFTPLLNEMRKNRQQLDKKQITHGQVDNLIILIEKKYDAFESVDGETDDLSKQLYTNISLDNVLLEIFIDQWKK